MSSRLKDLDGSREIKIDATSRPGYVYLVGRGFTYEFDTALFRHVVERELNVNTLEPGLVVIPS